MKKYALMLVALCPSLLYAASCCSTTMEGADQPLPGDSIYQLESVWKASDETDHTLASLRGPIRVVAMFYSSCTYACPMIAAELSAIQEQLPSDAPVHFTLFSFDPARDNPKALAAFAERQGLSGHRWLLLSANDDAARELAAVLGVRYRNEPDGEIAHSNQITLLDQEGRIVYQLPGLGSDATPLLAATRKLINTEK